MGIRRKYLAIGTAGGAGIASGVQKDKHSTTGKKVAKAVILGGGYSGYERARNQGQSRLKAGTKAVLGRSLYSAYKGTKKESITEKARKQTGRRK